MRWLKDLLLEYAEGFPQVASTLFHNIDQCIYGQRGFETATFLEMWNSYRLHLQHKQNPLYYTEDEITRSTQAFASVQSWLNRRLNDIYGKQMKKFQQYIKDKIKEVSRTHNRFAVTPDIIYVNYNIL